MFFCYKPMDQYNQPRGVLQSVYQLLNHLYSFIIFFLIFRVNFDFYLHYQNIFFFNFWKFFLQYLIIFRILPHFYNLYYMTEAKPPDFYFTGTLSNTIFFFSIGEKSPGKGCASYLTLLSSLIESSLAQMLPISL